MKEKINKEKINTEITNLTIGFCNSLKPRDKRFFIRDSLVPGLWLKVMPSGFKSWVYSCRPKGHKPMRIVVGSYESLSPAKARLRVKQIQKDMFEGKHPTEARQKIKGEPMLGDAIKSWYELQLTTSNGYRKSTIKGIKASLKVWIYRKTNSIEIRRKFKSVDDLQYKKISTITADKIKKLQTVIKSRAPYMSNRVVAYLRMFFNYAINKNLCLVNPCKVKKGDKFGLQMCIEKPYQEYLSTDEIKKVLDNAVVIDARNQRLKVSHYADNLLNPVACLMVAFQLRTARRTRSETSLLQWSMIQIENRKMILPQTKTSKHNDIYSFPLSTKAVEILKLIRREKLVKIDEKCWFRNRFYFEPGDIRNKYLFPSRDYGRKIASGIGKTPYLVDVRKTWEKLLKMSGVDRKLKHYATRHSTMSWVLEATGNIKTVAEIGGVSEATASGYAKQDSNVARKTLEDMEDLIQPPQPLKEVV